MSAQRLPAQIAPYKYARQGMSLKGVLSLAGMERLQGALASPEGQVEVDLEFGRDEQGTYFVRGSLQATVEMVCQRCMEAMPVEITAEIKLGFCGSDGMAEGIPDEYEPCVVEEELIVLSDLVEDELILALPLVALHPDKSCQPWLEQNKAETIEQEVTEERKNPFDVLKDLKPQK